MDEALSGGFAKMRLNYFLDSSLLCIGSWLVASDADHAMDSPLFAIHSAHERDWRTTKNLK